jgi:hypothetical protein
MPAAMWKPRDIFIALVILEQGAQQIEDRSVTAWLTLYVSSAEQHGGKRILIP